MVRQQHERGGQRPQQLGSRAPSAHPGPQAFGDRCVRAGRGGWDEGERRGGVGGGPSGGRGGEAVDHAGDEVAGRGEHRGRVELQPQRIGRRHGRDDDLQPLERQRPGRQCGLRSPARREGGGGGLPGRLGGGLGGRDRLGSRELAGPEQFGDVLEGAADGQAGGVQAAEPERIGGDLGDSRLDRDVHGPRRAPRAAAKGQPDRRGVPDRVRAGRPGRRRDPGAVLRHDRRRLPRPDQGAVRQAGLRRRPPGRDALPQRPGHGRGQLGVRRARRPGVVPAGRRPGPGSAATRSRTSRGSTPTGR